MTTAEYSVEIDAPPEAVWEVTSDPRNLPHWDRHIVAVKVPEGGLLQGSTYSAVMGFMGVRAWSRARSSSGNHHGERRSISAAC